MIYTYQFWCIGGLGNQPVGTECYFHRLFAEEGILNRNFAVMNESIEVDDGLKKHKHHIPDKHHRITHTEDMLRCTFLIRGTKPCKNRSSAESNVCQYHEPSRLAKERGLSILTKRPRSSTSDAIEEDNLEVANVEVSDDHVGKEEPRSAALKNEITRISGSQNRMYNPLATPLVDVGCVGLPTPSNWSDFFNNVELPVHLDIGSARGRFLIDLAEMNPTRNFIGIEIRNKLVEEANEMVKSNKSIGIAHGNCTFFCANLLSESHQALLEESFSHLKINRISVLFPDPWIKNKHQARRVVQVPMINSLGKMLCTGGELIIASDVEDVIRDARTKVEDCTEIFTSIQQRNDAVSKPTELIDTEKIQKISAVKEYSKELLSSVIAVESPLVGSLESSTKTADIETGFEVDNDGFVISNPFKPLASEREQVCEMSWRRVFRLIYIRR